MGGKTAIIIGAGPAGLTAAYELLDKTEIKPVIFEATDDVGGIARTVNYEGNRLDIGGHRFFTKSDRVLRWWYHILPLQGKPAWDDLAHGREIPLSQEPGAPDPARTDRVLLIRERVSHILFLKKFFDYPLSLSLRTLSRLGLIRTSRITLSYLKSAASPIRPERSLEDFFINRFGRELYSTFFRDYTEKVWGVPCSRISPDWGAQRVKGLSIKRALADAAKAIVRRDGSVSQNRTETSLIRRFLYPKFGPGQMWTEVARLIQERGGEVHLHHRIVGLASEGKRIATATVADEATGQTRRVEGDYFLSSMPVRDLIAGLEPSAPDDVREIAAGLAYRDFITVGLLLKKLPMGSDGHSGGNHGLIPDCWIYIQEPHVRVGRVQIFNNWSPYMVADPSKVWIGLEYFCSQGDELWGMSRDGLVRFAIREMHELGFVEPADVVDATVIKTPKTYPAYFGTYQHFGTIRNFTDDFANLFLIGRNGMHRYNNMDHSMLSAMEAVANIATGIGSKDNLWSINPEGEYHEQG